VPRQFVFGANIAKTDDEVFHGVGFW
jgi:hypothetical protein